MPADPGSRAMDDVMPAAAPSEPRTTALPIYAAPTQVPAE